MNEQIQEIFVEDIIPNRFQPRLTFDEKALQELSDSIKVHGVIQPLVLRRVGNKYEIIAGERRYKASCMAGLKKVPAIVREMNDNESAQVALIENVQRKNLSSIEEAQSYKNLLDREYKTQEQLANELGVSQSTIANKLRLLNLCDEVQNALLNEQISERHARSLLQLDNPDEQKSMLDRVIKERLTVKQLDNEIKKQLSGDKTELVAVEEKSEGENKFMPNLDDTSNDTNGRKSKNLFGLQIEEPTDLEASAPNLSTGLEEEVPPIAFNPFSGNLMSSLDENENENATIQESVVKEPEEQIETFDMFGDDMFSIPTNEVASEAVTNNESASNIGEQINSVREAIALIEKAGFKVEKEEYDFEDLYQITIKIKK